VWEALGGLGLFLLGMVTLTESLRAASGGLLRRQITRHSASPWRGALAGASVTALVQSSSATTLVTLGLVGAGLMTFPQALGVVFGANLGTTATGWIVAVFGFKLDLGSIMLPLVAVGMLLRLVRRGRTASLGLALAGFALIFVGIDYLQSGMRGLSEVVTPESFPASRLLLVGIGTVMTLVLQSSSAGVVTVLAGLHGGALGFGQAAALTIGFDIGTTVTAGIGSIGGSVAMKRTALAHCVYNVGTAVMALAVLPLYVGGLESLGVELGELALVGFHSLFNGLGLVICVPLAGRFAAGIERLLPERELGPARHLDRALLRQSELALEAAVRVLRESAQALLGDLAERLRTPSRADLRDARLDAYARTLDALRDYLAGITSSPEDPAQFARHVGALHAADHLDRLIDRARDTEFDDLVLEDPDLDSMRQRLVRGLELELEMLGADEGELLLAEAERTAEELAARRRTARPRVLERMAEASVDGEEAERRLDALRWLDRLGYHCARFAQHYVRPEVPEGAEPPD
jgi:phosphate:Na+ symporter